MSRFTRVFVATIITMWTGSVRAQSAPGDTVSSLPGIEIQASVDRAEMYVGDLIEYTISITFDSTYSLEPPPLGANLGAFDVKDYQPDIESRLPDGRRNSKTIFKLSTFTTGDYVIPPVPVAFTLPSGQIKVILAEPIPITVLSLLANAGDSVDIRGNKAPYEFKRDYTRYYVIAGGAFLVVAVLVWWWWRRRHRPRSSEAVDRRPAWEIAFENLALLRQAGYIGQGNFKAFYIELSDIWRSFLGRVYHVEVLEMTTEEFVDRFATVQLPVDAYNDGVAFLRHADLVKFAKYEPESGRADADFEVVHRLVECVRADVEMRENLKRVQPPEGVSQPAGGKP